LYFLLTQNTRYSSIVHKPLEEEAACVKGKICQRKVQGVSIMKIIKRSGKEVDFDITKIIAAIQKANFSVPEADRLD